MAKVTIRDVRKAFGSVEVIHGVNISVDDGEFIVLVGPSGCGKTTILRIIAGLESVTDGEIAIARDSHCYHRFVVNDVLDTTIDEVIRIILKEHSQT